MSVDDLWFAKQARFLDDPAIVELGVRHGPGGPLVIDALLGLAKLARLGGRVTVGYAALARRCFLDGAEQARAVLNDAEEFGVVVVEEANDLCCILSFPTWQKWQESWRQARQRDRDSTVTAPCADRDSTVMPLSRDRQQITELQESSLRSDSVESARLDSAELISELFAYWQQRCGHPHAKLTADRKRKVASRLRERYTASQIKQAIDGAAQAAFVSDQGKRHDDLELICRTGSKLEDFMDRAQVASVLETPDSELVSLMPGNRQLEREAA